MTNQAKRRRHHANGRGCHDNSLQGASIVACRLPVSCHRGPIPGVEGWLATFSSRSPARTNWDITVVSGRTSINRPDTDLRVAPAIGPPPFLWLSVSPAASRWSDGPRVRERLAHLEATSCFQEPTEARRVPPTRTHPTRSVLSTSDELYPRRTGGIDPGSRLPGAS